MSAETMRLPVLTVRQPWAWAIMHASKTIENRSRATTLRGPLLIHAGQAANVQSAWDEFVALRVAARAYIPPLAGDLEQDLIEYLEAQPRGALLGVVDLVGSVESSKSMWAIPDRHYWQLASPSEFETPIPAKGKLGIWYHEVPTSVLPEWVTSHAA